MEHAAHHHDHIGHPPPVAEHGGHSMGHSMAFHFGSMETILFKWWMPEDKLGMFFSCFAIVILCFIMETVRWLRTYRQAQKALEPPVAPEERLRLSPTFCTRLLFDGLLHGIQLVLSYSLMLIFMTFNVWLCVAVVIGEVVGRLIYAVLFPHLESPYNTCG